jgi:dynein heavy chain
MLRPGAKRLNWNSLGIHDFILKCGSAMAKFESLVNQIQKNARDIDQRLGMIENCNLFKFPAEKAPDTLPACKVCQNALFVFVCVESDQNETSSFR